MATWITLCENKDFRTLYYRGKSQVHPALVTYVQKNKLGRPRVGITTGKKLGGAVQRNRCRRVIREAFRALLPQVGGYDIVFVARVRTLEYKSTQLVSVMEKQLRQMDVIDHA
ncbi:MAG: ribonuclease P protein component [Clostridia bacterium]|nr:ribonuclease P protein component [Clostridia bacterium]